MNPVSQSESDPHNRKLIIGYGNIDRQDDGVAWHVLDRLLEQLGHPPVDPFEQPAIECSPWLTILYALQLTPEMAELIAKFDQVCYVDAHTGAIKEPLHVEKLIAENVNSPFTHHLPPAASLYLAQTIINKQIDGLLVSIQGHEFGFDRSLSPTTSELAEQAIIMIFDWINKKNNLNP